MLPPARAALPLLLVVLACGDDARDHATATDGVTDAPTSADASSGTVASTEGTADATQGPASDDTASSLTHGTTTSDDGEEATGGVSSALVTIDDLSNPTRLLRIDIGTGAATEMCTLPAASAYDSITFATDGTLYAHNIAQNRIETINPCNCGFQIAGATGAGPLEITTDGDGDGLVGIDIALDAFSTVNPTTGLSTVVGPLGIPVSVAGLAWDHGADTPIMIDTTTNALYAIDRATGLATHVAALSQELSAAGMDVLAPTDELFVCAADTLLRIDTATGLAVEVGSLGITTNCHNLAAPPVAIACLE